MPVVANPSVTAQAAALALEAQVLLEKVAGLWSGATKFSETLGGGWACQHLAEAFHAIDHATAGLTSVGTMKQDSPSGYGSTSQEVTRLTDRSSALTKRLQADQA